MMDIILHSDDVGITSNVTWHILDAWRSGHLDGFSIIGNGEAINQIPDILRTAPDQHARIAVHFNLTEGKSSAPEAQIPMLVDANGQFKHTFGSLLLNSIFALMTKQREFFDQINIECIAQIAAVRPLCAGRTITAIDGHNHIHMIPGIFAAVACAAHTEGIPEIRISAEPFFMMNIWNDWLKPFWWINLIKHHLLNFFSISAFRIARQIGLQAPSVIIGVLYSGNMSASRAVRGIEAALLGGATKVEVLFHVGRASSAEAAIRWKNPSYAAFHLSELRDEERTEIYLMKEYLNAKDFLHSSHKSAL